MSTGVIRVTSETRRPWFRATTMSSQSLCRARFAAARRVNNSSRVRACTESRLCNRRTYGCAAHRPGPMLRELCHVDRDRTDRGQLVATEAEVGVVAGAWTHFEFT